MRLNHIDLSVPDLEAAERFFTGLFGFRLLRRAAERTVLVGDGPFVLVLSPTGGAPASYPADFHIGFLLDGAADLDALCARLTAEGHALLTPPGVAGGGGRACYCKGPGGITVEIAWRPL
jgi:catechol 2,3-dioxygenase-like lactoylglutathione lyase family enzyme